MATLQAALGNTDPTMPAASRQMSDAQNFVSDFGARTSAIARDAECRAIPYPGPAMRAPDARTGCGWWFSPNPSVPSTGAYGSRRGAMSPNLDSQIGPGEWVWDMQQAYQLEGMKMAAAVQACPDLQFAKNPNIGWCPSTGRAIMTDGQGNPAFAQMAGGDCPGGGIIMSASNCPPPPPPSPTAGGGSGGGSGGASAQCQPMNGVLSPVCLQTLTGQVCSPNGGLAQALGSGYAGSSDSFNAANKYLLQRGFTLNSGLVNDGRVAVQDALSSVSGLKTLANTGDGSRTNEAAMNLCFGTPFNPCQITAADAPPFDSQCITQTALGMGFSASGSILPAVIGMDFWNQFKSWGDVVNELNWVKAVADKGPSFTGTPAMQQTAIGQVYGLSVKYPKQGCNNFGVFLYRYFFPTWDSTLFPTQGSETHFLGRYILKNGFPNQGSTMQDMTPAGGYLTEGQRMVADFFPTTGGTYQFLIQCDDFVRMQLNGQVIGQVGCCGVPTPTQTVQLVADQSYPIIIDLWNGGGPWSFGISYSVNGAPWQGIPVSMLGLPQDRRLPMLELAFNKMTPASYPTPGASIEDTNNVFQNLFLTNTTIGSLNGRNCMIVNGPISGIFNYQTFNQGVRLRAMKSITMMIQINSSNDSSGVTPSIFSFFNLPETNTSAYPRRGFNQNLVQSYFKRTANFAIVATSSNKLGTFSGGSVGEWTTYPVGQWFHIAFVWDDDFAGYTMYLNGIAGNRNALQQYPPDLIMEQIRIGCDHEYEGQFWTGGIAWFRAFDYRLSQELITLDMNDSWASLN